MPHYKDSEGNFYWLDDDTDFSLVRKDLTMVDESEIPPPVKFYPNLQPYQFFAMLELSGNKDELYNFIDRLPSPNNIVAKAKLEHTLSFARNDSLVETARIGLGITKEQLDALWEQALTL